MILVHPPKATLSAKARRLSTSECLASSHFFPEHIHSSINMFSFLSIITFFSLFLLNNALPTRLEARGKRNTCNPMNDSLRMWAAISTSLLSQFSLFEQYAGAAYCKDNDDDSAGSITCSSGNCPLVQQAGAKSVLEFSKYMPCMLVVEFC